MKNLLLLGVQLLPLPAGHAQETKIQCSGENTVEMRYRTEKSWQQSNAQLRQQVSKQLMQLWHESTREACDAAHAPYKDGTIHPQLVVGCDDRLNRALLQEFKRMDER